MIGWNNAEADVDTSLMPPGERRETGAPTLHRQRPHESSVQGDTGLGVPRAPSSESESRPARMLFHTYHHDQQALYHDENTGGHVAVGRHPGIPRGDQEPSEVAPARPMFRTPPGLWTDEITEQG